MKALKTNKVLISVYNDGLSPETNDTNHRKAKDLLDKEGIAYHVVVRCLPTNSERVFVLTTYEGEQHDKNVDTAYSLGLLFSVKSFLEVFNDDTVVEHSALKGSNKKFNKELKEFTKEQALPDEYFHEPVTNRYFSVV